MTARTATVVLSACLLLLGPGSVLALDDNNPAFRWSPDKRVIAKQIEAALPAAEKGYQQLQTATSEAQIAAAIESIFDSYRYLRAAEESGRNVEGRAADKDPLAMLRYDHISNVRLRLRWCRDNRTQLLAQDQEYTNRCLEGLVQAIRELRLVVTVLP